jgi:hypothetical protein
MIGAALSPTLERFRPRRMLTASLGVWNRRSASDVSVWRYWVRMSRAR